MKWVYIIAGVVVALVLVVVLIGLMLPKSHRATRMARFRQTPEAVFAAISGPQDWRPGITVEQVPSDGGPRKWREKSSHGAILFEEAASDPPRLYKARIADRNLPFGGTWTYEISPAGDGCVCRIMEDGEVYNPVFRFVSRFMIGQTKTIEDYLNALGKKFDEPVKIEE
jgi:polyketide cyclase/dehydrase/lipid transport protein